MPSGGNVVVFGPSPMLSVTVEAIPVEAVDDIHLHAAGQGVWVARMAAELGADALLCGYIGGESGTVLRPLLEQMPFELRLVETGGASGCYLHDRRSGEREPLARAPGRHPPGTRSTSSSRSPCAAALDADVLAVCGAFPAEAMPLEIYGNLVADVRANGTPVVVDLSPPRLDSALEGKPDLVKINDWELASYISAARSTRRSGCGPAAERLLDAGAGAVIITRAEEPALVMRGDEAWELVPPRFERGVAGGLRRLDDGRARGLHGGRAATGRRRCAPAPPPAPPTSSATASAAADAIAVGRRPRAAGRAAGAPVD